MTKQKFKISDKLGVMGASNLDEKEIVYLPITYLAPNPKNFYNVSNLDALKTSIQMHGVLQPLRVLRLDAKNYRILAGHRRHRACYELHLEGKYGDRVPCIIEENISETTQMLQIIETNSTARVLSSDELRRQVRELKDALLAAKAEGVEIPGSLHDLIAEELKISASKAKRLDGINRLVPGWMGLYEQNRLGESVAYEISQLDSDRQLELYDQYVDSDQMPTLADVKKQKNKPPFPDAVINKFLRECVVRDWDKVYDLLIENNTAASKLVKQFRAAAGCSVYCGGLICMDELDGLYDCSPAGIRIQDDGKPRHVMTLSWTDVVSRVRAMVQDGTIQHSAVSDTPEAQVMQQLSKSINQAPKIPAAIGDWEVAQENPAIGLTVLVCWENFCGQYHYEVAKVENGYLGIEYIKQDGSRIAADNVEWWAPITPPK